MKMQNVCAIILDYRGAENTAICAKSLIQQGINSIRIVDNGESQGASETLELNIHKLDHGVVDIKILKPENNLGFANGVNYAIQNDVSSGSSHEYYLLVNNDAVIPPLAVSKLYEKIQEEKNIVLVAPAIKNTISDSVDYGQWYNKYLGILTDRPLPFSFFYASGCCMLIHRNLLKNGNLFDPSFFMYGEDSYLGWCIRKSHKNIKVVRSALVLHAAGSSSKKAGYFYEYHTCRAHYLLAIKTWDYRIEIPVMVLVKTLSLFCRACIRSVRYRSAIPLLAMFTAWIPLPIRMS